MQGSTDVGHLRVQLIDREELIIAHPDGEIVVTLAQKALVDRIDLYFVAPRTIRIERRKRVA